MIGTAIVLTIGGIMAGYQSAVTGHGFWKGFANHVQDNFLEALVTSFAFAAVTVAASNFIQHAQCFIAGTLLACLDEEGKETTKPIEDIKVGDKVLAYDEKTGKQGYKEVVRLFRNETKEWYHIFANGEEIICTSGHPFYVVGQEFVQAKALKSTDKLILSDGKSVVIEKIEKEELAIPETTYNFEVEDYHTYYVSKSNVLVHNRCVTAIKNDTTITRDIIGDGKYGTYDITFNSGEYYIGKGGQERMWQSASMHETGSLRVVSVKWRPATSNIDAFIQEAKWMKTATTSLLNKIASPGFK